MYYGRHGITWINQLFKKDYLFPAPDEAKTLIAQIQILGRQQFDEYIQEEQIPIKPETAAHLPSNLKSSWNSFNPSERFRHLPAAYDLLDRMLRFNLHRLERKILIR